MPPQPTTEPRREDSAARLRDRVIRLVDAIHERRLTATLAQALVDQVVLRLDIPISWSKSGHHVKIKKMTLADWSDDRLYVKMDLNYKKTRGFPQYSTTGTARGRFDVSFTDAPSICLSDLTITELNLRRVPNWLDNTWIRNKINSKIPDTLCVPIPDKLVLDELVLDPNPVSGGSPVTCEIQLNGPARHEGATVLLTSSEPSIVTIPASVTFQLAATTAQFPLLTQPVEQPRNVNISARLDLVTKSVTLAVVPLALESLKLSPTTVKGGNPTTCTIRLTGMAPAGGSQVTIATNPANVAQAPATITVPAGDEDVAVEIPSAAVTSAVTVTISGTFRGATKTATLTVVPKKANLIVKTVNFFDTQGNGITAPEAGRAFKACINVVNVGDAQAAASKLRVDLYKSGGGVTSWEKDIPVLAPSTGATSCIDVPALEAGHYYDFNMYADFYNVVNESDENNYGHYGQAM
jgi:hypothetical protein